jgi:hypothetical protein
MNQRFVYTVILIFFLSAITLVAQKSTVEIELKPAAGKLVKLTGFDGFRADTLSSLILDQSGFGAATIPYRGFILLVMEDGRIFPLILDKKKTKIFLNSYSEVPQFAGDEENTFLYTVLTSNQQFAGKKMVIAEGSRFFQTNDPFRPVLDGEMDSLVARKERLEKSIWARKEGMAGLLIQGKSLIESTSEITTREQLDDQKTKILKFIQSHQEDLRHTDMLRQLAYQYEMMNEYIRWGKYPYEVVMVNDVGTWIDSLGKQLGSHQIVNYFLQFYLDRSMVSMAIRIAEKYESYSLCPALNEGEADSLSDMEIKISDTRSGIGNLKKMSFLKILFFYNSGCPACIAEQISLMRTLKQEKAPVPAITLFSASDEEKGLSTLTRLQREPFLYAVSDKAITSAGIDNFPAFLVVSPDQKTEYRFYTLAGLKKWIAEVITNSK